MDFPKLTETYPLDRQYNIWSHSTNNRDWTPSSYTLLHTFDTLRGFFDFFHKHPEPHSGMFFIMKDPIVPTWEDSHNQPGGCWSFKLDKEGHMETWGRVGSALIANILMKDIKDMELINGVSLTIRKFNVVMKIWNNDRSRSNVMLLKEDIPELVLGDSLYQAHEGRQ